MKARIARSTLVALLLAGCTGARTAATNPPTFSAVATGTSPTPEGSPPVRTTSPRPGAATPTVTVTGPDTTTDRPTPAAPASAASPAVGRGFPDPGPWLVYYGDPAGLGDLTAIAKTYRIFILQGSAFTAQQVAQLQAGGRNRVLCYLDVGSAEHAASYWSTAPAGLVPAGRIENAQLGPYGGYPDETWMNPASADWEQLLLRDVAPAALANGADGLFLDNLELLEHGAAASDGPCDHTCTTGGLELVYQLRQAFPNGLLVQNNATSAAIRTAAVHGVPYPSLLDGVVHEEAFTQATTTAEATQAIYHVATNPDVVTQLDAWKGLALQPGGHPFWIGTLDFVNTCTNTADVAKVEELARTHGYSPSVSDKSAGLQVVCSP